MYNFIQYSPVGFHQKSTIPHRLISFIPTVDVLVFTIFMPFLYTARIFLELDPGPDNAWRLRVVYGSIKFYSPLQL